MKKLEGRVAIITGSTSGIGEGCAKLFAENGATVVLTGRNTEKGLSLEKEILSSDGKAKYIACDITVEEDIKVLIKSTIEYFGHLDILMNNAGTFLPSVEIERLDLAKWKETFEVNVDGYFLTSKYAKPYLIESKGVILNTSSVAGMQSYAAGRSYAYSAAKAAVIQFSHMMAKNYASEGIRVNCICPGIILTPMLHGRDPKIYEERIPMGRVGSPEDVARAALFLVSDDSAYLTGVVLPVDGGASL